MTPEERIARLREQMLVQAELVARFERDTDRRLAMHEEQLDAHSTELAEFRATVTRVLDALERFVSGQGGGNGHGTQPDL